MLTFLLMSEVVAEHWLYSDPMVRSLSFLAPGIRSRWYSVPVVRSLSFLAPGIRSSCNSVDSAEGDCDTRFWCWILWQGQLQHRQWTWRRQHLQRWVSYLVRLNPVNPQRITSGLRRNFSLSPCYSFHKSHFLKLQIQFYSQFRNGNPKRRKNKKTKNNNKCFGAYLYSAGTQNRNLRLAGWTILFYGPRQEPVLVTANTGKTRERYWKKCRWMDRKGRNYQGRNPCQQA